jgi:uncharacterized integral membrane protein
VAILTPDKMRVRRRMAKTAFVTIILTLVTLLVFVGIGDKDTALNLNAASGSIAAILAFLTLLVMGYMGLVHHTDIKEAEKNV